MVESSASQTSDPNSDSEQESFSSLISEDSQPDDSKSNSSQNNEDLQPLAVPRFMSRKFLPFFNLHHKELNIKDLARDIAKDNTLKSLENLTGLENFSEDSKNSYCNLLKEISGILQKMDYMACLAKFSKIAVTRASLNQGINLKPKPHGLDGTALLYKNVQATALDILIAIERDEVNIINFPDKTRSVLMETLLIGLARAKYPIKWSKSTKWL